MHLTENCQVYTKLFFSAFWFVLRVASVIVGGVFTLAYIIHVVPSIP